MPAFCRFIDSSNRPRLALAKNFSSASDSNASPMLCPLTTLLGEEDATKWELNQTWIRDYPRLMQSLPEIHDDSWIACPDRLLPPIDAPQKVLCIGLNYLDHAIETGSTPPSEPIVFSKFNTSLIGHGEPIVLPSISERVDYEAELVVVVGRQARHVSSEDALEYVFGYTAGHDVSARDWQKGRPGGQWLLAKSFDSFAPIGPCVVTSDEMVDSGNVRVRMRLNDEIVQDSTTAQLIFGIGPLIAHLSRFMTLHPGDLIFTGTPPGVGIARMPPRFLTAGDQCTVLVEGIGALSNSCIDEL